MMEEGYYFADTQLAIIEEVLDSSTIALQARELLEGGEPEVYLLDIHTIKPYSWEGEHPESGFDYDYDVITGYTIDDDTGEVVEL